MLLKLSKFFLYSSVFAVLVVLTNTFFPFIGGKDYFFRWAIELSLVFLILSWAFEDKKGEIAKSFKNLFSQPLFLAVSFFVLIFLLASAFALDSHAAFWSNYERGEGGFAMLHYYVFFVLMLFLLRDENDWRRLFKLSLVAAVFMIGYGVAAAALFGSGSPIFFIGPYLQPSGQPMAPTFWGRLFSNARFQGSLGNPAYVAPYLIFSIFYALYLLFEDRARKEFKKWAAYGGLAVFFFLFFYLSETRGSFLGLGAAVFLFLAYAALYNVKWRKPFLAALAVLVLVFGLAVYYRDSGFTSNLPGGRLFHISLSDSSLQTRFWTWGSAWDGFLERPLLGWGPENFSAVFDKYFNPKHYVPGKNTETWFDRAHSVFFDYLAETGILGLLSYLGIFAVFYWQFFKTRINADQDANERGYDKNASANRRIYQRGSVPLKALMFAMPIAYLVQGLALFDVLPIYINLFIFLAFATFKLPYG